MEPTAMDKLFEVILGGMGSTHAANQALQLFNATHTQNRQNGIYDVLTGDLGKKVIEPDIMEAQAIQGVKSEPEAALLTKLQAADRFPTSAGGGHAS